MSEDSSRPLEPAETKKIEAETEKILAEIAKLNAEAEAETIKAQAEARQADAEALRAAAETVAINTSVRLLQHDVDREDERRQDELAAHRYHHVYLFKGEVTEDSTQRCMNQLTLWDRKDPKCDIEIVFNSPGGSLTAGLALWDHIKFIQSRGHQVTTSTVGMAASMAAVLLQAGDIRIMGKESWLLIHEASFGAGGSFGEVEDRVDWIKRIQNRIVNIFAERSNLTPAQIKKKWTRTDWWIDSNQALEWGLVDELR